MPANKKIQPSQSELMRFFSSGSKKREQRLLPAPGEAGAPSDGVWLLQVTNPEVVKIEKEDSEFNGAEYVEFRAAVVDEDSEYHGFTVRHSLNFFDEESVQDTRYQFEQILGADEWDELLTTVGDTGTPHDFLVAVVVAIDGEFFAGQVGKSKGGKRNGVTYRASNRIYEMFPSDRAVGQTSGAGF